MGFPGGPVVKAQCFHCRGSGSNPGGELRSHMPRGMAKTNNPEAILSLDTPLSRANEGDERKASMTGDLSRLNEPRSLAPKLPETTWDQDESRMGQRLQGRETDHFHKASLRACQQLLRVINHLRQDDGEKPGLWHVVFKRAKTECSQLVS